MPVTRDPQYGTIEYTVETAIADAWRFAEEYPGNSAIEARVAYHTVMNLLTELGVRRGDRNKVMAVLVDAELGEYSRGWSKGWRAGSDHAKSVTAPPF